MELVALVGRPNVGKSALFNRLTKKRAIVGPQAGITRDRNIAPVVYRDLEFMLMDTGGFEPVSQDNVLAQMREQSLLAIEDASIILFMTSRLDGFTQDDKMLFQKLRQSKKPIYFLINKTDAPSHENTLYEFYESGIKTFYPISSAHGYGISDLMEQLAKDCPLLYNLPYAIEHNLITEEPPAKEQEQNKIKLAILGKPNAGKSSLFNAIFGESKQIVDNQPGTTRDPINQEFQYNDTIFDIIDTAGIRRKAKVSQQIDKYSIISALRSMEKADVCLLVIDSEQGITEQDARIASYIFHAKKALILVFNKWDLQPKTKLAKKDTEEYIADKYPFLSIAPFVYTSAVTKYNISGILKTTIETYKEYNKQITTSKLNQILSEIIQRHTPPGKGKRRAKIKYITQLRTASPLFVIYTSNPDIIPASYENFLKSQFRYYFGLKGVPINFFFRDKNPPKIEEST